jgi:hypothetical protein
MSTGTSTPIDLWDELERIGIVADTPEDALLTARVAVRRAARTESLCADVLRARRRRRVRIATLAVGTVAASVVFGVTRLNVGGHQVGPSSAAASVLERAADVTLAQHDLVVGPGQYLRVRLVEQSWATRSGSNSKVSTGADGRPAVSEERRTRTVWIPHDIKQPWIIRNRTTVVRNNTTDPTLQEPNQPTSTWSQASWAAPHQGRYIEEYDPAWYATLPRDPAELLKTLRAHSGAEGSGTAYDFEEIYSEILRSGVAPADIRAALFKGLAQTPGMRVENDVATLNGHRGIGIGYGASTWQMVFDATTGRYIGERATDANFPAVPGLDADKTTWLTSVTTTVVDRAPEGKPAPLPG